MEGTNSTNRSFQGVVVKAVMVAVLVTTVVGVSPRIYDLATRKDYFKEANRYDPQLGSKIAMSGSVLVSSKIEHDRVLLVALGSCSSCSIDGFDLQKLIVPNRTKISLIVSSDPKEVPLHLIRAAKALNAEIICDPSRTFERTSNAVWLPRMFLLDRSKRLIWAQERPKVFANGISYKSN